MRSINLGRWSRYVERYFNIKGGGGLMDVEQSIRVILPIFNGVEDRYPQGWNRYAFSVGVTGGAAQSAAVQLRNPVGSNVIAVVERMGASAASTTGSRFDVGYQSGPAGIADLTTTIAGIARLDGRTTPLPSSIASSTTNATFLTPRIISFTATQAANANVVIANTDQQIPMLPGSALMIFDETAAETAYFDLMWRERALEASELT